MTAPLISTVAAWLASLVTGASGTGVVVPAGTFRADDLPTDTGLPGDPEATADRRLEVRYVGGALRPFAGPCRRAVIAFEVRVGYRYDTEPATIDASPGEAHRTTAANRAGDDAWLMREVLLHTANLGASSGITIVQITPGDHRLDDPGYGVLIGVLPVEIVASYDVSTLTVGAALP